MSACACMGPIGNCPCLKAQRGEKVQATEIYISQDLFSLLSEEEREMINRLKVKALALSLFDNHTREN
jgi:hypothetical protein